MTRTILICAGFLLLAACEGPQQDTGPRATDATGAQLSADKYCKQYGMHAKYTGMTKAKKLSYDCVP